MNKHRVARIATAFTVAVGGTVVGVVASAGTSGAATVTSDDGSYVSAVTPVDSQMFDLSIYSTLMKTTVHARVIVPATYFTNTTKTYPSLYLLSGSGETTDWMEWSQSSPIESFMAGRDVMTVMPEDGSAGNYTDWLNKSSVYTAAKPAWETFQAVELPQLLSRGYRANGVNAIAGISEAGIGVIDYPARHPGLYKAAASFSGMLSTQVPGSVATVEAEEVRAGDNTDGPWGDPVLNASTWAAHNPVTLVKQLAAAKTTVWLGCGNGNPGPGDTGFALDSYVYEQNALSQAQGFATKAKAAGVPVVTDFYGAGAHNWPAWIRAFPNAWSTVLAPGLGVPA
jgi:S-formylglutathione hydrolase FrmB